MVLDSRALLAKRQTAAKRQGVASFHAAFGDLLGPVDPVTISYHGIP